MSRRLCVVLAVVGLLGAACGASDSVKQAVNAKGRDAAIPEVAASAEVPATESAGAPAAESDAVAGTPVAPWGSGSGAVPSTGPGAVARPGAAAAGVQTNASGPARPAPVAQGGPDPATSAPAAPGGTAPGAQAAVRNTASDVGVTPDSIKIGGYFILSGPLYDLAGKDPHRLWQSAVRYYNDAGGVNGRRYIANPIDSQLDCGPGMASLRKAVEQDKIFAIAGSFNPYLTLCAGPYLEAGGIPSVPSDNIDPGGLADKTTFGVGTTHYRYARIGVRYTLNDMGAQNVSVLTHSDKAFDTVEHGAKEVGGARLKAVERVAYDEANLAPLVQRLRASGVESLYVYLNPDRVILLLQEMERQGYRPPKGIMGGASMVLDLIPQYVGKFAEGINGMSWVAATDSAAPGIKEIKTAVARYAPDARIDQYSAGGYAAFRLFHHVVKSLGANVTRKGVIDRFNSLTNFDNAGLEPPLTYRPDNREANRCMQIVTVRESKWRFVKDWVCDQ